MDYRGAGWDSERALNLCKGLNDGEAEAVLAPGPCKLDSLDEKERYNTLCETTVGTSLYLPKKVPGMLRTVGQGTNRESRRAMFQGQRQENQ